VKPDGTVADPIVEDSSGIDKFEQAAIKSILATRYAPATWNGKPVEQCAAKMMYHFTIAGDNKGARPAFISDYRAAVDLVTEKRVAEAEAKLDEMTQKGAWNNYESSRLWLMRAALQYEKGDRVGQLKSLRRSTLGGGMYLEPKIYRNTLRTIFALETSDRQFGAALSTYEKLKKFFPPLAPLDEAALDKIATEIQDVIDGPDTLGFPGVIEYRSGCEEGRPNWKHELLRRKFAFSDIQGKLDKFEVRCDWKRVVDDVSTDKTWEIPQSWGWCQVFVFGDLGSRVKLLEYPLAESQKKVRLTPITIE
jgi:hypothetical protein